MNQPVPEKYRLFAIWDCVDPAHVAKLKGKKCFYIIYPLSKVSDLKDSPKKTQDIFQVSTFHQGTWPVVGSVIEPFY